jgi:hypothetical protein
MLIVLLLISWLAIMALFVAICHMAARGDAASAPPAEQAEHGAIDGVVVWSEPPPAAPRESRVHRPRGRITAHSAR